MLSVRALVGALLVLGAVFLGIAEASAQVLGTFRWRFEPYCNIVHLTVVQQGPVFSLSGFDDDCGFTVGSGATGTLFSSASGLAVGSVTIVKPGGVVVTNFVQVNPTTGSGTWSDNFGQSGNFVFNPTTAPGSQRPVVSGQAPSWVNVNENATLRSASPRLAGTVVLRPPASPVGVYCLRFPPGAPVTGEAAVGSVQQGSAGPGVVSFIVVTVTFTSLCDTVGAWDVAVQTYTGAGLPADRPFTVVIPGSQ